MDFLMRNPYETSYWMIRLRWMLENEPQQVKKLYLSQKLAKELDHAVLSSLAYKMNLEKEGMPEDAAEEMMLASLAPTDGPALNQDPPPEPLTERLQSQLLEWARNQKPRTATITI